MLRLNEWGQNAAAKEAIIQMDRLLDSDPDRLRSLQDAIKALGRLSAALPNA